MLRPSCALSRARLHQQGRAPSSRASVAVTGCRVHTLLECVEQVGSKKVRGLSARIILPQGGAT
eukprot:12753877-Alexandrium_andersonii.AAC.1